MALLAITIPQFFYTKGAGQTKQLFSPTQQWEISVRVITDFTVVFVAECKQQLPLYSEEENYSCFPRTWSKKLTYTAIVVSWHINWFVWLCNTKPNNVTSLAGKLGAFCLSNHLADIFSAMLVTISAFQKGKLASKKILLTLSYVF